jgi:hypothetical protein
MPIPVHIVDSETGKSAKINGEGELNIVVHPHPPRGETQIADPYRQRFANSAGSTDMAVDGSTTAVDFFVTSTAGFDTYVKVLSFQIGDAGGLRLDHFGGLGAALSNGVEICYSTQDNGTRAIHDGIKTNLEFIRLGNWTPAIGDTTNAFKAETQGGGGEDSYIPIIDLASLFGLDYGIRLREGTNDKIIVRVQDNLTGLTTFDCIAYGLDF